MKELTPEQSESLRAQIQVLRNMYATKLREKVQQIQDSWAAYIVQEDGPERQQALVLLHRQSHTLAGSAATFGFAAAGEAARRAEVILKALMQSKAFPDSGQQTAIEVALADLYRLANTTESVDENQEAETAEQVNEEEEEVAVRRPIFVFTDDPETPHWYGAVASFGFNLRTFRQPLDLWEATRNEIPAAIVVDCRQRPLEITAEGLPLSGALAEIHREIEQPVPVVWACQSDDLLTRLQTVRLGGAAFLSHPVDADTLIVKLDDLTAHTAPEPFRVLIIDDEPALSRLYSLILRQAGMITQAVNDPLEVMEPLVEFKPDLLLMDVYMPGCSGVELAAVIRQQEAFLGLPIVFLSVERDIVKQLEAMRQGGDDFLLKPLQPKHLVSAVTTRALRARTMRNLMQSDTLTGMVNHTRVKEQLGVELDRARRLGHKLCVAVVDIDHIAAINTRYGHATGDNLLKSLSRLLRSRLRQTDVVGRHAGDSFLIVMNNSDAASAKRVLDGIRATFASITHRQGDEEFRVSFSAGLATSPPYTNVTEICEAAERGVATAKSNGRNCIELIEDAQMWSQRGPLA